jgi:hypothetical protein
MRAVRVRDAVQRQHLHNCKLQYLYNNTAHESVKYFNLFVVLAPWRLRCRPKPRTLVAKSFCTAQADFWRTEHDNDGRIPSLISMCLLGLNIATLLYAATDGYRQPCQAF